jgi:hypothetical protein
MAIQATNSFVFCPPLPGKPDPHQPWDPSLKEKRPRVALAPQKGHICTYYAIKILRDEQVIGKYPSASQRRQREIEMKISRHRKVFTKVDGIWEFNVELAKLMTRTQSSYTRRDARLFLEEGAKELPCYREECCTVLRSFCEQEKYDDFVTYTEEKRVDVLADIGKTLLGELGFSYEKLQQSIQKMSDKNRERMSVLEKLWLEENTVFIASYRALGLQHSSWHPLRPIEALIEQLRLRGPHLVSGTLGRPYYQDPPFELPARMEGRPVFGWKENAQRLDREGPLPFHVVVIVGAKIIDGKGRVYFIDPRDGSDPKDMTTQQIYVISYERLRSSIATLFGTQWKTDDGQYRFKEIKAGMNDYALCR